MGFVTILWEAAAHLFWEAALLMLGCVFASWALKKVVKTDTKKIKVDAEDEQWVTDARDHLAGTVISAADDSQFLGAAIAGSDTAGGQAGFELVAGKDRKYPRKHITQYIRPRNTQFKGTLIFDGPKEKETDDIDIRADIGAEFVACALTVKLLLGAAIPHTLALLAGKVSNEMLFVAATVCAVVALVIGWVDGFGGNLYQYRRRSWVFWGVCMAVALASPLAVLTIAPLDDYVSLLRSPDMLGLVTGELRPLQFQGQHPAFWEAAFIPSFVLGQATYLHWLVSLQAVILCALCSFILSRELGLDTYAASLVGLIAFLNSHLWATGVGTLQNSPIFAAGLMLLALVAVRFAQHGWLSRSEEASLPEPAERRQTAVLEKDDRPSCLYYFYTTPSSMTLLAGGLIFAATRYSGVVAAALICLLAVVFAGRALLRPKSWWGLMHLGLPIALLLGTSGLYYLRNFWEFQHLFHPVQLSDLAESGVLAVDFLFASGTDFVRLFWVDFLPPRKTEWPVEGYFAGLLLVPMTVFYLAFPLSPLSVFFDWKERHLARPKLLLLVWSMALALWLVFLYTPWSPDSMGVPRQDLALPIPLRGAVAPLQLTIILTALFFIYAGREYGERLGKIILTVEATRHFYWLFGSDLAELLDFETPPMGMALAAALGLAAALVIALGRRLLFTTTVLLLALAMLSKWFYNTELEKNHALARGYTDIEKGHRGLAKTVDALAAPPCSAASLAWPASEGPLQVGLLPNAFAAVGSNFACRYLGQLTPMQLPEAMPSYVVATWPHPGASQADLFRIKARLPGQGAPCPSRQPGRGSQLPFAPRVGYCTLVEGPSGAIYARVSGQAPPGTVR